MYALCVGDFGGRLKHLLEDCVNRGSLSELLHFAAVDGPTDELACVAARLGYPKFALSLVTPAISPTTRGWILIAQGNLTAARESFSGNDDDLSLLGLALVGDSVASQRLIESNAGLRGWGIFYALLNGDKSVRAVAENYLNGDLEPITRTRILAALSGDKSAVSYLAQVGDAQSLRHLAKLFGHNFAAADAMSIQNFVDGYLAVCPELSTAVIELETKSKQSQISLLQRALQKSDKVPRGRSSVIGSSAPIMEAKRRAEIAATSSATLLITGESGTGKEVFARAVHEGSKRAGHPFVGVNCAALSSSLIESELFGYESGAFTGASVGGKSGKFEQASGGTLLLDEIGDMPIELQVKLLRVLQEKTYYRVGGNKSKKVNCRIIATTNQDLHQAVREGRFRSDLFYRLQVLHISLPALAERPKDVELLARHFAAQHSAHIEDDYIEQLKRHTWPGNVRELFHTIERDVLLKAGVLAGCPDLSHARMAEGSGASIDLNLADNERGLLVAALRQHKGQILKVARSLGVSRGTVYNKLKKFSLSPSQFR